MKDLYFDCAATTKTNKEVLDTFNKVSLEYFANANSNHALGATSLNFLNRCRKQVASFFKVKESEVIFTSGATEANNLALFGVARHNASWGKHLITTKAEHPSVLKVFEELEKEGFEVTYLNYDKEGNLDFKQLEEALNDKTTLVSIMNVNNEVGYIFDIKKAYSLTKKKTKAFFHTDATQAVGKIHLDPNSYDLLTMSSHKIEGLKGSGLLIKKEHVFLDKLIQGGSQENNYRPGTTPLPLIASTTTAIRLAFNNLDSKIEQISKVSDYLYKNLENNPNILILSNKNCSKFIFAFALLKHKASVISEALSKEHIYVGSKSACSEKVQAYSSVIYNASYSKEISENAIRLSFCGNESVEDAKIFVDTLNRLLSEIKERKHG